jgi:uncharacterized membrane protein/glutaredoxin
VTVSRLRQRPEPFLQRWARPLLGALATVGAIDTGAVTLKRWGLLGSLTCPGGADGCDKVLNSPWGTVLGQPLALFGFLAYLTMALLALLPLLPALQTWLQEQEIQGAGLASRRHGRAPDLFWQLGTLLALGMAVFSLVLLGLMAFRIHAVCAFCVLSAVLSLALLLLHWVGRDWPDRGQLIFRTVVVGFLVALLGVAWAASVDRPAAVAEAGRPLAIVRTSSPASLALAEHLTANGARIFTAWWCPHCHEQKELFGRQATAQLKVIECAPDGVDAQVELCKSRRIEGFPTWEINGKLTSGVKTLNQLADLSGYKGSRSF